MATLSVLVAYLAIYPGLFSHFGSSLLRRFPRTGWGLLPPLWVALEWIRAHVLSGFPWGIAGYSLTPCLPLVQVSAVTGVYGISFLVVLANVSGAAWLAPRSGRQRSADWISAWTALLFVGVAAYGARQMSRPAGGPAEVVGLIQAAIPQDEKWSRLAARAILEKHEALTMEAANKGARLIVWPESSSPFPLSHPLRVDGKLESVPDKPYRETLESLSRRAGASLLIGTVDYRKTETDVRPVNAAAMVHPDGSWERVYAKMHLVPFGEYVPMAPLLGFVNRLVQGAIGDFLPGREAVVVRTDGLARGHVHLLRDGFSGDAFGGFPLRGADLLANLTNDAWFGSSSGPHQHFQMAVLRAVENRRYLVRAANTGISAIVDPRGRVLARAGLDDTAVLTGTIHAVRTRTLYTRIGDVFAILCVILTLSALAADFAAIPGIKREDEIGD